MRQDYFSLSLLKSFTQDRFSNSEMDRFTKFLINLAIFEELEMPGEISKTKRTLNINYSFGKDLDQSVENKDFEIF